MLIENCPYCLHQSVSHTVPFMVEDMAPSLVWPAKSKTIAFCAHCGGGYAHEVLSDSEISDFYASAYLKDENQTPSTNSPYALNELTPRFFSQVMFLKAHLPLENGIKVLEIGPNEVSALPALCLFSNPEYYYFDQVESQIITHYGGQRLGNYASPEAIRAQILENSLGLIYGSHSFEHLNPFSVEGLFRTFAFALRPGGALFFEVPDDITHGCYLPPHTLFFSAVAIEALLRRTGFELVVCSHFDGGDRYVGSSRADAPKAVATSQTAQPWKERLLQVLMSSERIAAAMKPYRLKKALPQSLKSIGTPYEPIPYFRVIARKVA